MFSDVKLSQQGKSTGVLAENRAAIVNEHATLTVKRNQRNLRLLDKS
jgi:hypothetical protein